ncbi:hypothetical protein SAMD00019534_026230, partial [Acytostelium subglobosum LB1]|uniref:hypothetical protein n=1 Tax=Acytostelium subglobosum LB1 TaxID=1410327 RepID=UPI0006450CE9
MKFVVILSAVLLFTAIASASQAVKLSTCRAVTMSGAGDRGAFEAGIFAGLVQMRQALDVQWNVVTGISAGSINAAATAMFNVGDEEAASNFLTTQWDTIKRKDMYASVTGWTINQSLAHSTQSNQSLHLDLVENLNAKMLAESNRTLLVGATSYDTGLFNTWEKDDDEIVLGVKASASIPGLFEPTAVHGQLYMDGGATYMTPVTDTARLCNDTGAETILIDVILGVGKPETFDNVTNWKTPSLMLRTASIVEHNIFLKDIETAFQAYPSIKINLYYPSQRLPGDFLGFQYSKEMIAMGIKDANAESSLQLDISNYNELLATLR